MTEKPSLVIVIEFYPDGTISTAADYANPAARPPFPETIAKALRDMADKTDPQGASK